MLQQIRRFRAEQNLRAKTRWSEPIGGWRRRLGAWASLLIADHGLIRPVYWNAAEFAPGVWRGPQPNPLHIAGLARRGLRTIVNLRGPTEFGSYALEREAAERHGLALIDLPLQSRAAPRPAQIHAFRALIEEIAYPALFHCKSGADRSGLAAALYLIIRDGVPVAEAWTSQLSIRFGHLRAGPAGLLDAVFQRHLQDTRDRPMAFLDWVDTVYDPEAIEADFHAAGWAEFVQTRVLHRE